MDSAFPFKSLSHSQRESTTGEEMANTINVDRAIQNEMAYRRKRKIETLQLQPYVDSGAEIMPVQVQFPSPNPLRPSLDSSPRLSGREQISSPSNPKCLPSPTPIRNPFLRPNISSGPRISERKQGGIGSSSNIPPPHQQSQAPKNLNHHSFSYYCEDCQVPCAGSLNYKQHINGKKHKLKLQELTLGIKDGGATCAMANEKPWCKLCKIWCSDYNLLKMHLAGQKHKKMQAKLGRANTTAGEVVEEQHWCELCGIGCSSKELLQSHFAGKKHQAELRKLEYAQKGSEEAQNQPKRCKVCKIQFAHKNSLQRHLMEKKHFFNEVEVCGQKRNEVEVKKRQWQHLIRAEGNNS